MASREGFQELVMLFDTAGSKIEQEMRLGQFSGLLAQKGTLGSHAASVVKAAYVQVSGGLVVRAAVFFVFKVNEQGYLDPAFNLPLEYMAHHAGAGPDVGNGPVNMACRSQCPVPWHAINMWEPAGEPEQHPLRLVQKAVWRNRLSLKVMPERRQVARLQPREREPQVVREAEAPRLELPQAATGTHRMARVQAMEEKLTATFGEAGRVDPGHREQLTQRSAPEPEPPARQQAYLEQLKSCREEIQQLKAALRHEQQRNRRLQQLLRGEV